MKFKKIASLLAFSSALACNANAFAQGDASTGAAGSVALATLSVIAAPIGASAAASGGRNAADGSMAIVAGVFLITSISGIGDKVSMILEAPANASNKGSKVSVTMSKAASEAVGASVGTTVTAVSETLGTALVVSGKVLAFIPNELGKALIYQARVPAAK